MTEVIYEEISVAKKVIRLSDEAAKRRDRLIAEGRCLGCEKKLEPGEIVRVQNCPTCYEAVRRKEETNPNIRQEMVRKGRQLPPGKGGRKPSNKFTQELAEM